MFYHAFRTIMKQITNTVMMIKPTAFRYNEQTAVNNYYQKKLNNLTSSEVQNNALCEFVDFVKMVLVDANDPNKTHGVKRG